MARRKFSDIRRAGKLQKQLTAYNRYLADPPEPRIGSRGALAPRQLVHIVPFGMDIEATEKIPVRAPQPGVTRLASVINARANAEVELAAPPTGQSPAWTSEPYVGFKPAMITTFENATRNVIEGARSKFTNTPYNKYEGTTFRCPFGKKATADDFKDSADGIKAALRLRNGLAINRISISNEVFAAN